MTPTSVDYMYVSNTSIFDIKNNFLDELKKIGWENPIIEIYDDIPGKSQTLFITKNQEMYDWFDEQGYNLNDDGEGAILLIAELQEKKQERITVNESMGKNGIMVLGSSDVFIVLNSFWEYYVSLPEMIEKDIFSQKIHEILVGVLASPSGNK